MSEVTFLGTVGCPNCTMFLSTNTLDSNFVFRASLGHRKLQGDRPYIARKSLLRTHGSPVTRLEVIPVNSRQLQCLSYQNIACTTHIAYNHLSRFTL
ncbi:unnamed protein product [Rodentolepis nana]|uniref:Uncharacterized protein n=1 Tax=Rodentolepis nana TaxID=102285 RepID=A0A0R3TH33_RODNA|nr:unnamed protein product [Rodentolepis nana]